MGEDLFDTSLPLEFFIGKIQNILNKNFSDPVRQKVIPYPHGSSKPKRLNFSCPICGDSEKKASKRRGNLWMNTTLYHCYNCDSKMSFLKFLKTFEEDIQAEDKIKLFNYIDQNTFTRSEEYQISALDKLIPIKKWMEFTNQRKNSWLVNVSPIKHNSRAYQYLKYDRLIGYFENIYEGEYRKYQDGKLTYKTPVIINLNRSGDKLLGIQLRNLEHDKNRRFYKIVEFEELYNYVNPGQVLDEIEAISYNKLSHFYNMMNVNFDRPVNIFEGYLDALSSPNSIGLVGASNDEDILKFLTEAEEELDLRFFYDKDDIGNLKAQKMIDKGFPVFLWHKFFEDMLTRAKNKSQAEKAFKKVKDLNDLVKLFKNPKVYESLKLEKFFSQDEFDKIYLEKSQFNW
jgi:hypothetical protein